MVLYKCYVDAHKNVNKLYKRTVFLKYEFFNIKQGTQKAGWSS